jgi:hypothetical protein
VNGAARGAEGDARVRPGNRPPVLVEHLDLSVLGQGERLQRWTVHDEARHRIQVHARFGGQGAGGAAELLAEVAADPVADDVAEDHGEADQDDERQAGGGDGDPPADRKALEERKLPGPDPAHAAPFST